MEANSEPENPGSPEGQQVLAQSGAPSAKNLARLPLNGGFGVEPSPAPSKAPPRPRPRPQGPSPRPRPSCEAGIRAALSRRRRRAVRCSTAQSRPELGGRGCTSSRDPTARDPSLCRRRPQGAPGRTMVKVTFNSALAQKEAKKDEPKSSEEALIIPPDAVAVNCKVRAGVSGGVPAAGTGGRTAHRFRYGGACAAGGAGSWPQRPPWAQVYELQPLCTWLGRLGTCSDRHCHHRVWHFLPV